MFTNTMEGPTKTYMYKQTNGKMKTVYPSAHKDARGMGIKSIPSKCPAEPRYILSLQTVDPDQLASDEAD